MPKYNHHRRSYSLLALLCITILFQLLIHETNGRYIRSSLSSRRLMEEEEVDNGEVDVESETDTGVDPIPDDEIEDEDGNEEDEDEGSEDEDEDEEQSEDEDEEQSEDEDEEQSEDEDEEQSEDEGQSEDNEENDNEEDTNKNNQQPKPIMHTFFQRIDPVHHHEGTTYNKGTGMSNDERHASELATWQFAWQDAGFDTVILNIDDVKKHDNYDDIRTFLDHEAFGEYDELCFLRWFAMVTTGGGWMSDYDVVPLKSLVPDEYFAIPKKPSEDDKEGNDGFPLPYDGKFTVYDGNGRVPSLMSGSAEEWDRMASALLALAHEHRDDFYSDMYALQELGKREPGAFEKRDQVVDRLATVMTEDGDIECLKVWNRRSEHYWTVHFSHYNIHDAVENGIFDKSVTADDRPWIEREFVQKWKEECADKFDDVE